MKEQDMEGPELQRRAEIFRPWLETEGTELYMEILGRKIKSLERQLKSAPSEMEVKDDRGNISKIHPAENIQGKIEAHERMKYLPQGVIKTYNRKFEQEKRRKEKEKSAS